MNIPATDYITFATIHLAFYIFIFFAFVKDILWKRPGKILRGEESQKFFYFTYGFVSVIVLQFIQVSEAFVGHKVLIAAIDLSLIFYLSFYNGWFRNWILGHIIAWKGRPE